MPHALWILAAVGLVFLALRLSRWHRRRSLDTAARTWLRIGVIFLVVALGVSAWLQASAQR